MAKRIVVWTETAAKRREILKYWTKKNASTRYAEKLIKLTTKRIGLILKHPESFKFAEYHETRESAMGHFSIYYKLTNEHLIITAFWDNRQDPKKLLELIRK
ncbi:MAG TPA: type II toxin-antitoxin system RelE/ParE family toxin [Bacteroidales bacterium]|nr:type II toxin-antitoxin system RelE/ParE family toxin [Bacteroidales bacterium]